MRLFQDVESWTKWLDIYAAYKVYLVYWEDFWENLENLKILSRSSVSNFAESKIEACHDVKIISLK